jgi:hypothetical protein
MLLLSKVAIQAVGFISDFLGVPVWDGRYSTGCQVTAGTPATIITKLNVAIDEGMIPASCAYLR